MHAAYDDLSPTLKSRLANANRHARFQQILGRDAPPPRLNAPRTHRRAARARPPSVHPVLLTHPITGRKVLYANPGYTVRINEFDEAESDRILEDYPVTSCSRSTSTRTTGPKAMC